MAVQLHRSFAVHPGPWLREEIVEPRGLNVTDLAAHMDVARQSMSKLLNGRQGLSADMAIRFEKAFKDEPLPYGWKKRRTSCPKNGPTPLSLATRKGVRLMPRPPS